MALSVIVSLHPMASESKLDGMIYRHMLPELGLSSLLFRNTSLHEKGVRTIFKARTDDTGA